MKNLRQQILDCDPDAMVDFRITKDGKAMFAVEAREVQALIRQAMDWDAITAEADLDVMPFGGSNRRTDRQEDL